MEIHRWSNPSCNFKKSKLRCRHIGGPQVRKLYEFNDVYTVTKGDVLMEAVTTPKWSLMGKG